jgi:hypothetical protein
VVSYRLWSDKASGSAWEVQEETISESSHTVIGLTQGQTYRFKVEALNAYGYSFFSNVVEVLSAQVPAQPSAPVTTWAPDDV